MECKVRRNIAARVQNGACQHLLIMIDKVRLLNASDDSPKGGNPFGLCVLVRIRQWDNLEDPPQWHFPQLVGDWLYGILGVIELPRQRHCPWNCLPPATWRVVFQNSWWGRAICECDCVFVPVNWVFELHDLFDHPAKRNVGERHVVQSFDALPPPTSAYGQPTTPIKIKGSKNAPV
jgi:hypothetical protein